MPLVKLGDICEFLDHKREPVSEELRKHGPYPYYGANGQQGWIDDYIFDEPLVLLAEDGGHFGSRTSPIAYRISGKTWVNNHAHVLRPLAGCDVSYLAHALSFYDVSNLITGSTRPKLTKGKAETIRIPLPSLHDQQRIACQLEEADRLRCTRSYALELSDSILPAAFLQLFGDPITNPRHFCVAKLVDFLAFVTSGSRGWAEYYAPEGDRFIRSLDVRMNSISEEAAVFVSPPKGTETERTRVKAGDVLLTITGSRIGRVALVPERLDGAFVSQHVAILRLEPGLLPVFLSMFLSLEAGGQRDIARLQYGQTKPGLNFDQIREFRILVPPLSLQEEFAAVVTRAERLSVVQRESLRQAEHLFQSLLDGAFTTGI